MPAYVTEGERLVIPIRSGDETLAWETEVLPACTGIGYWYCVKCEKSLAHNMEAQGHAEHKLAWICYEHGPEVP